MKSQNKERAAAWLLGAACCFLAASSAQASGAVLDANSTGTKKVSIDGWLKEWGSFTKLSQTLKGNAGGDRASVALAYDARALYVALTIKDSEIVRTAAMGGNEDRVELSIAVPKPGGGHASYDLWLFSGIPGKSAGAVKLRGGRAVPGAKLVEAATDGGVDIEVSIPWSSLPATSKLRVGLHAAVRYVDYAGGKQKAIIGTSDVQGGLAMPPLRFENEQGLDRSLLSPKGLGPSPDKAVYGNVTGDAQLEQVALYGGFLTILGSGYRGGKQFFYKDLSVKDASMVPELELEDLTGDGRAEIILRKRVGSAESYREYVEVMSLSSKGEPFVAFEHETAIVSGDGKIENKVSLKTLGGKKAVVIADDVAEGWDQGSFREAQQGEMGGALLPWDGIAERSFAWDGKQFKQVGEKKGKPRLTSAGSAPSSGGKSAGPPPPPAPRPPTADELQDQVYALYRKSRNVGKAKPSFDFVTNVYGGPEMERVLVHGLDVVVFGKGYRGGTGFAYITLPAKAPEDVVHVTAKDLNGDGKAEIVVRATLKTKTSEEFGGIVVERQALLVYEVGAESLTRIFGAETGRVLGDKRVVGGLLFKPLKKGFELQLKAGRVVGWDKASYPFPVETGTAGGLEPLLLPWGSVTQLDYRYEGGAFKRQ
ncbi:MAG: hypothetical protein KC766_11965 [Myxococcales bacterium]|nr:hypothetical protein [Myxococcales bacterium]